MKIICDNCRTKYSIADEKVKGKVFKIRCKKCQNIIVVRGNQENAEAPAAAAPAPGELAGSAGGETPVWHLVIGHDQVGPMTPAEVRERFSRGEINADTYIWREGFTDWVRITTVEDFSDLGQGAATATPSAGPADQAAAEWDPAAQAPEASAGQPAWDANAGAGGEAAWSASAADPGADWQSGAGAEAGGLSTNQPLSGGGGQDLFGFGAGGQEGLVAGAEGGFKQTAPPQDSGAGQGLFQSPAGGGNLFGAGSNGGQQLFPSEDEQPAIQMKGARHENSVLFSLANLQALAMGGKAPAPAPSAASSRSAAASPASARVGVGADGSGLIDIRSMASPSSPAPARSSGLDDLPDLGGYSAPIAAAPVLMPAIADERPRWLLPAIIGVGGALVVVIVALVLVLVLKEDKPQLVAAVAPTTTQEVGGAAAAQPDTAGSAAAAQAKTEDTAAESEAGKNSEDAEEQAKAQASARRAAAARRPGRRGSSQASPATVTTVSEPRRTSARASAPAKPKKGDELDDLIDSAIHGGQSPKKAASKPAPRAAAAPDPSLPETLSRGQIQGGMQSIKAQVQGCYDRFRVPGLALTHVVIGQNGRIGSVRVKGVFAGTPTGACVESAVRSASFAKFKGQPISIEYPFQLR